MVSRLSHIGLCLFLAFAPAWSIARAETCHELRYEYERYLERISDRLRNYVRCLERSGGRDDCGFEFGRLSSDQFRFERIVKKHSAQCF